MSKKKNYALGMQVFSTFPKETVRSGAFLIMARAMAVRCFSPPDRVLPRSALTIGKAYILYRQHYIPGRRRRFNSAASVIKIKFSFCQFLLGRSRVGCIRVKIV